LGHRRQEFIGKLALPVVGEKILTHPSGPDRGGDEAVRVLPGCTNDLGAIARNGRAALTGI
jgi:hypothetical protein